MNHNLWTAYEAAAATGGMLCVRGGGDGAELPEESWSARGISIDTRTIRPGEIFVALKDARDGHDFIRNAFKAGASAALVSKAPQDTPDGAPLLLVNDTLTGLEALAAAARDRCFGQMIAVTGSAGKTSTKEMLRAALVPSGKVHAAERSFNNHLGVPLTLAELPNDTAFGVFEIGMNHAGEITPLTRLVRPHIAIVTTVAAAHLEFFDNMTGIAEAKAEIFAGLRKSGVAILPRDNEFYDLLKARVRDNNPAGATQKIVSFGSHPEADYRLLDINSRGDEGMDISVSISGETHHFRLGLQGEHQAMNAMAVLAAVDHAGGDRSAAMEALAGLAPVEGRGLPQVLSLQARTFTLIDESYNANPASMAAAIRSLAQQDVPGRKIVVLGEMKELGSQSAAFHLELAPVLEDAGIDKVYAAGNEMRPVLNALPSTMRGDWAEQAIGLADAVSRDIQAGDVVMAKGSNASKVSALVKELQNRATASG
ncbi:UDP-N-acetylmuramoyl-tripeptide--D-alanyl-D-alanine ligase [Parvularcula sp. IMCC14364]|uniref:UDP-N-acetylmuramoyl-tripeptide--D-alanyl-D- alanine ligase n=1 Tax=Parvularcula sp. IMCC14364 TaxID=3067902 RepID=UPI0027408E37|nr:UDP-N-acetylmuramoyl-tripeptide--D-alanyl-D-alanine ligase [Parvularcula sp. IMCC14364]